MNRVHVCISDLFFNYDMSDCLEGEGLQARWIPGKVREKAEEVLGLLEGLGVQFLPTVDELVDDFERRL